MKKLAAPAIVLALRSGLMRAMKSVLVYIIVLGLSISSIGMVIGDIFIAQEMTKISCPHLADMATASYIIAILNILLRIKELCVLLEVGGAVISGAAVICGIIYILVIRGSR
jgi:hypothetical protein